MTPANKPDLILTGPMMALIEEQVGLMDRGHEFLP